MEKDIIDGKLGAVGSYDIEFKGGKLVARVSAAAPFGLEAGILLSLDSDAVLDAIARAIPGSIDDAVVNVIKGALKL